MFCPKCGFDNREGVFCCVKCGTKIPQFMQQTASEEEQPSGHDRLRQFEEAVDNVRNGAWSLEQFDKFLHDINEVLTAKEREIHDIAIPEEASAEFKEELEIGFSGIALYNQGIAQMMKYVTTGEEKYLDSGISYVRKGNERILEAMRVNRENRDKLEEELSQSNTEVI